MPWPAVMPARPGSINARRQRENRHKKPGHGAAHGSPIELVPEDLDGHARKHGCQSDRRQPASKTCFWSLPDHPVTPLARGSRVPSPPPVSRL